MKLRLLLALLISCSGYYGFGQMNKINKHLISTGLIKSVDIDTNQTLKQNFIGLNTIENGVYQGVLTIHIDSSTSITMLVFSSNNETELKSEVRKYFLSASCKLSSDSKWYYKVYKVAKCFLFLPKYPCFEGIVNNQCLTFLKKLGSSNMENH